MDVTGTAVGIASLGIQVCQGLLTYYDGWKEYQTDISSTYDSITKLCRTLVLIKDSAECAKRVNLDQSKATQVQTCLDSCTEGLHKLQKKLQKLRTHSVPTGFRQKAWTELQRTLYPFRQSTLIKLQEIVADLQSGLGLAIQALHLDISISSDVTLRRIDTTTQNTASDVQTLLATQQAAQFQQVIDWLAAPDPWTNHVSARRSHEAHTGDWLLNSDHYRKWKAGQTRHLWLYGKAGCGKTVLCSTVIEDLRGYCETATNSCLAVFYFSFSDSSKRSMEHLLRSLIVQVARKEPERSLLQREHDKPNRSALTTECLETIFLSCIESSDQVHIVLDALDECPETGPTGNAQQDLLYCLERLSQKAPKLKLFVTSRELRDIRDCMASMDATALPTSGQSVDSDLRTYVASMLLRDRKLKALSESTKALIMDTFTQKADGMFRWAYCQLQELRNLKSTRASHVRAALLNLPRTLDETYERILARIDDNYRNDALVLLRWLSYSRSPLTLNELVEATIIDLSGDGAVDFDDRGGPDDVLDILSGLVTIDHARNVDQDDYVSEYSDSEDSDADDDAGDEDKSGDAMGRNKDSEESTTTRVDRNATIRLAHFSVQEYLESKRVLQSIAQYFHLDGAREHRYLAQSCLIYLMCYSGSEDKRATKRDLTEFPLLEYAARSWYYHCNPQQVGDGNREVTFLESDVYRYDWLRIHDPDREYLPPLDDVYSPHEKIGSGLYYAYMTGLKSAATALLEAGADVDFRGGLCETVLQAASSNGDSYFVKLLIDAGANVDAGREYASALVEASSGGHEVIVQMLLQAGADVNAHCAKGMFGNALEAAALYGHASIVRRLLAAGADVVKCLGALHAACRRGDKQIVEMLLEAGADVNVTSENSGNALHAASEAGSESCVELLLDAGADGNMQRGRCGNALQAAVEYGHVELAKMLVARNADVNAAGGRWGSALQAASSEGQIEMVEMLLDAGCDINAEGGYYGNALQAALFQGHEKVVALLIKQGADVSPKGEHLGKALQDASREGNEKRVLLLLGRGADVNAQSSEPSALQVASYCGHENIVALLTELGPDVNAQGSSGTALQEASAGGYKNIVSLLIAHGADVDAQGPDGTALYQASAEGREKVVSLLIEHGADVNAQGPHGNAIQEASARGHGKVVSLLIAHGADVDAQGPDGTALHQALAGGYEKVVSLLIAHGAIRSEVDSGIDCPADDLAKHKDLEDDDSADSESVDNNSDLGSWELTETRRRLC